MPQSSVSSANRAERSCVGTPKGARALSRRWSKNDPRRKRTSANRRSRRSERSQPTDHEWDSLQELFLGSRPRFVGLAYSVLRNKEDAEDAVQDALVSAFRHLRGFEGRSALTTWFTRIVLNAALMIRRKRKTGRIEPLPETHNADEIPLAERIPDSHPDPETACAEKERIRWIDGALGKMSPLLRQAITMTYFDEMSNEEGGALLGIAAGTFKSRVFRAREDLMTQSQRTCVTPLRRGVHSPLSTSNFGSPSLSAMPMANHDVSLAIM